ncbi:MAG: relaxase/mobilization nuclease domain-containing protein [Bacteroidetes bacterium]|nr:relaxase/mobilization nuclease domain-containing protein [Bacteroidota bacterium]
MLAIVESSTSIRQTLLYNENKIETGQAILLDAHNFWQEKEDLNLRDKLQRFKNLTVLNERCKANTIHISLNFHPIDNLTDKQMVKIAAQFMKGIDFQDQPWLVYRHHDAGHPHMHVVTTNIRPDGTRIKNDKRSPHQLMQLCQKIEMTHELTPVLVADLSHARHLTYDQADRLILYKSQANEPIHRLEYGEQSTKQGIARVLDHVLDKYAYTSLEHFNAILQFYRVRADRGSIHGAMYQNRGLLYRMIDTEGRKIGAPIKASAFQHHATLDDLERRFTLNVGKETDAIDRIEMEINYKIYVKDCASLQDLREALWWDKISIVTPAFYERPTRKPAANKPTTHPPEPAQFPTPDDGHGFFFIDHLNRVVLRDTQIAPSCTAARILQAMHLDTSIPTLIAEHKITPSKSDARLLQSPDPQKARNALLRLTPQHDQYHEQIEKAQRQTQRHRLRPGF